MLMLGKMREDKLKEKVELRDLLVGWEDCKLVRHVRRRVKKEKIRKICSLGTRWACFWLAQEILSGQKNFDSKRANVYGKSNSILPISTAF